MFFNANEFEKARDILKEGQARADALAHGDAPWTKQTGLVVRAYISEDRRQRAAVWLVIPPDLVPDLGTPLLDSTRGFMAAARR